MASGVVHKPLCCTSTIAPALNKKAEPVYSGPTTLALGTKVYLVPSASVNRAIKCQQIPGGDRYATIGDGTQTYMSSLGPLSGIADIANELPERNSRAGSAPCIWAAIHHQHFPRWNADDAG